ncbi:winged helix-turn-helix domain-containing protein [Streptomyces sp. NPDC048404]|uniref:ArsR/SmtB family transcription factor n=1 Tax=unclassified Streptomyces TaxID=2593676 RepID=UPI00341B0799
MLDVTVIEDAEAAAVSLDPIRSRLLAELAAGPASAAMLAGKVGLPRQKVNYHLKTLERHGLVELAGERRKGNVTERMMRATAASYVISPQALAAVQPDPDRFRDQLSARWLLALGARLVRDVGLLVTGAAKARKRLATYALDGEVTFASAADRAAFIEELTAGVSALIRKYHDGDAEAGRPHRIVVAVHPTVKPEAAAGAEAVTRTEAVAGPEPVGQPRTAAGPEAAAVAQNEAVAGPEAVQAPADPEATH